MADTTAELKAMLTQRSLADPELLAAAEGAADFRVLPDATVLRLSDDRKRSCAHMSLHVLT
jgi:molybdenum storage protein